MKSGYSSPNGVNIPFSLSGEREDVSNPVISYNSDSIDFQGDGIISGQIQTSGVGTKGLIRLIYRSAVNNGYADGEEVKRISTGNNGIYTFTGINETYTYDVIASNDGWHDRVLSKVKPFAGFSPPKMLKVHYDKATKLLSLSWYNTAIPNEIRVYKSEAPFDETNMPAVLEVLPGSATSYNDIVPAEGGKTYYYAVSNIRENISLTSFANSDEITPTDPMYDQTRLILNFDGPEGSNVFIDQSPNPVTVETHGNVMCSATHSLWGTTSARFTGELSDFLQIATTAKIELTKMSSFTIETYVFIPDDSGTWNDGNIINKDGVWNSTYPSYQISWTKSDHKFAATIGNGAGGVTPGFSANAPSTLGEWHHVAIVRLPSKKWIIYVDGVNVGESGEGGNQGDGGKPLMIGIQGFSGTTQNSAFKGFIQGIRLTEGIRWTSNFTPDYKRFPTEG